MDFYESWWWLHSHPINRDGKGYNNGMYDLDIYVALVNPADNTISEHKHLNTKPRIWLEFGSYYSLKDEFGELPDIWQRNHDPRLDCGGDTFEDAIKQLAILVRKYYGDYHE